MKKICLVFIASIFSLLSYSFPVSLTAGFFYDEFGNKVEDAKAAWIIDTQSSNFEDFELEIGMEFQKDSFLDSTERYFILDVVDLDSSIAYLYGDINPSNPDMDFSVDDTFAVICWTEEEDSSFATMITKYTVYSDDSWVIPQSATFVDFDALTLLAGGNLPEDALVLNQTPIPEPALVSLIFGGIAFVFGFIRRKNK